MIFSQKTLGTLGAFVGVSSFAALLFFVFLHQPLHQPAAGRESLEPPKADPGLREPEAIAEPAPGAEAA
ncbi:MAG: hypothetical protein ACLFU4_01480, partial [Opitutales bacterium]